ncbi:MAG: DUF2183 domain-containing protein [Candidatus Eremiobacteraeota bacterium]|nr:DUF2183 domain-containing protein [Candidatus Eremiobacteraeota bacterium]
MSNESETALAQTAGEIADILSARTRATQEGRILSLIRLYKDQALVDLLDLLELDRLLNALDNRLWGPDSRKEFIRLLDPVIEQISVTSKAVMIRTLARKRMNLLEEKFLTRLFMTESGEQLTQLKLDVDKATDGYDLLHILYNRFQSADLRFDLIQHFLKDSVESKGLRVVSDIDDTLYSSLYDQRFPRGTVYPGVLELLSQLSPHPPIFLTARPELPASLFERFTHQQLKRYGIEGATVLSGSLPGLFGHQRMANQKARTLTQYIELYPEFRFIFIGDSGQGDMALAQKLLGRKPPPIERALIHKLSASHPGSRSDHRCVQIFEDYGQAAAILAEHGYLDSAQVEEVQACL